jgi:prephenate dehydrogenase
MSVPDLPAFRRVAVVGCGLIGGSFAFAAAAVGSDVTVFDTDAAVRRDARVAGLHTAGTLASAVRSADLVLLAGPPDTIVDSFRSVKAHLPPTAVVTDTASTKGRIALALVHEPQMVCGHPMAGAAVSGFSSARRELFAGCTWALCPSPANHPTDRDRLARYLTRLGVGRIVELTPDDHDRAVAAVSHIPQLAATVVAANAARVAGDVADTMTLAASGFRDTTRVASSPGTLWSAILHANRTHVTDQLATLITDIQALKDAVEAGDEHTILQLFENGNAGRALYDAVRAGMTA